jgi:hypothetical protein
VLNRACSQHDWASLWLMIKTVIPFVLFLPTFVGVFGGENSLWSLLPLQRG